MKNVEIRNKMLEDAHVIDNFMVGYGTQNVKENFIALTVEDMRLFVAVEQGSEEINKSLLVTVLPKAKLVARK